MSDAVVTISHVAAGESHRTRMPRASAAIPTLALDFVCDRTGPHGASVEEAAYTRLKKEATRARAIMND